MRATGATIVGVALLAGALAACGGSSHSSATTPSSVRLPIASTTPGQAPKLLCGVLTQGAGPVERASGPANPGKCFTDAYAHCVPATLDYTKHGVDVGDQHTFTIVGGCSVVDDFRHYSPVRSLNKNATYPCATVATLGDAMIVRGCGALGDIEIAAVGTK